MKKVLCLFVIISILVCILASCGGSDIKDPIATAKKFGAKDYYVNVGVNDDDIEDIADEMELSNKGIICVLYIVPDDYNEEKGGLLFYCENNKTAKKLAKDAADYLDDSDEGDYIYFKRDMVKKSGKIVFVGCEDVWEAIK